MIVDLHTDGKTMISVCGPNEATSAEYESARKIGEGIARAGHTLVCGGRGGVMAAAAEGTKRAGGTTIGILPDYDKSTANQFIDHAITTGLGHARNAVVVASGDAVIAIGGGFGTLSEIGLALKMGKVVVHVESWPLDPDRVNRFRIGGGRYVAANSPESAVSLALEAITTSGTEPH